MPNVRVYERDNTPRLELGQHWIRLIVHAEQTNEDEEAENLFRSLAIAIDGSDRLKQGYILTVLRIRNDEERFFGELPEIVNGSSHEGMAEVRRFVSSYSEDVSIPSMC